MVVSCGFGLDGQSADFDKALAVAQLRNMDVRDHTKIQLGVEGKTFNMTVPYSEKWMALGKNITPFLQQDRIDGGYGFDVGKIVLINNSVQDVSCSVGRAYAITINKGTLRSVEKSMRDEYAGANIHNQVEGEDLPTVSMRMGSNKVAMIPDLVYNSGGVKMVYGSVSVQRNGYVINISAAHDYNSDNVVDAEILRMAASFR